MPTMEVVKRRFLVSGQLLHRISDYARIRKDRYDGKIGVFGLPTDYTVVNAIILIIQNILEVPRGYGKPTEANRCFYIKKNDLIFIFGFESFHFFLLHYQFWHFSVYKRSNYV